MKLNLRDFIKNNISNLGVIIIKSQIEKTKEILKDLEKSGEMGNYKYEIKEFGEVFALRIYEVEPTVYYEVY